MADQVTEIVDELAGEAGDVSSQPAGAEITYSRSGRQFAVVGDGAVELRLMPDIAEAATRTPSAGPSTRGDEWVRFAPPDWDDHARDRLEAWFRVAWRLADQR